MGCRLCARPPAPSLLSAIAGCHVTVPGGSQDGPGVLQDGQEAARNAPVTSPRGGQEGPPEAALERFACMLTWLPQYVIQHELVHGLLKVHQRILRLNDASKRNVHPRTLHRQAVVLSVTLGPRELVAHRRIPSPHGINGSIARLPLLRRAHQLENLFQKTAGRP